MDNKERRQNNKPLVIMLSVLCVIIFVLAAVVIYLFVRPAETADSSNEVLIDTSQVLPDTPYEDVSDITKAYILSENIQDKLSSDLDYNPEQAVAEYDEIYQKASGGLKVYVAIEYANYIYDTFGDLDRAAAILEVEDYLDDDNRIDYYVAVSELYESASEIAKADYYKQIVLELVPDEVVDLSEEDAE